MIKDKMTDECLHIFEENHDQAHELGFYWRNAHKIIDKIKEETAEVEEAIQENDENHLKEELGDLIHAVFSLCRHYGFSPQDVISQNNQKFQKRFDHMRRIMKENSMDSLNDQSLESLVKLWQQAKEEV